MEEEKALKGLYYEKTAIKCAEAMILKFTGMAIWVSLTERWIPNLSRGTPFVFAWSLSDLWHPFLLFGPFLSLLVKHLSYVKGAHPSQGPVNFKSNFTSLMVKKTIEAHYRKNDLLIRQSNTSSPIKTTFSPRITYRPREISQ